MRAAARLAAVLAAVAALGCAPREPSATTPAGRRALDAAGEAFLAGRAPEAVAAYRALLAGRELGPDGRREARFGWARAELARGRTWRGLWQLDRLLLEDPAHAGARATRGLVAYTHRRLEEAVADLEALAAVRAPSRDETLAWADAALRLNRFAQAESLFTTQLAGGAGDGQILEARAVARRQQGDLEGAAADHAAAAAAGGASPAGRVREVETLLDLGRVADARKAAAGWPAEEGVAAADAARGAVARARLLAAEGRAREALREAERAAAADSGNLDAWSLLAWWRREAGDLAGARAAAEANRRIVAERGNPARALAETGLVQGAIALEAGDTTAALAAFEAALAGYPADLRLHCLVGTLAGARGDRERARVSFGELRRASGGAPPADQFRDAGLDLLRRGLPAAAAGQFAAAEERRPGWDEAIYFRAHALAAAGDTAAAIRAGEPLEPADAGTSP